MIEEKVENTMEYYGINTGIKIRLYVVVEGFEEIKSDTGSEIRHPPALMRKNHLELAGRQFTPCHSLLLE